MNYRYCYRLVDKYVGHIRTASELATSYPLRYASTGMNVIA